MGHSSVDNGMQTPRKAHLHWVTGSICKGGAKIKNAFLSKG
jgi:hypothetical protein